MKPRRKLIVALTLSALALSGCYVVPVVNKDGSVQYYPYPLASPPPVAVTPAAIPAMPSGPIVLSARLYPDNDAAALSGVVSGTVTNILNGKGRFQLDYRGEILTSEATVVDSNAHRGAASATGSGGGYMSCEYQLANARQGAGSCIFSSGARYRLHIGG